MSGTLKTLINGGLKIYLRPLHCTRVVRSKNEAQHGAVTDNGGYTQQLLDDPYWEDLPSPPDVRPMYTETRGDTAPRSPHSEGKRLSRKDSASFLKPEVSLSRLQATDSIISIVFGLKRLAWAHVDRTLTVRDWQQHEWVHLVRGKQHADLYLEDVCSAVSQFPAADIYILEKSSLSSQNASMFPVTLHLRIVEAMLYALLNPGYIAEQAPHRVFSMGRTIVGKHFDIMVGGAKTSGVDLVQRLVEEATTTERPRIQFTEDLIFQYKHRLHPRGQNRNEEMCDALLQAIAFYELTGKPDT
ncbi:transcription elongation factor, mitochondrial [Leptodactylus fuscus]|uniref:transcription elongation factor, mitochondrial n=1 Tax=Leptodactylus fuscus TaxID=238119 RepID=UPI003F4E60AA